MGWRYPVRRFAQVVPTLAMILLVTFVVISLAPGDPAVAIAGEYAEASTLESVRTQLGLDRSLWEQMVSHTTGVLRGDFGSSYFFGRPVSSLIAERLPATLLLTGTALLLSCTIGILLGRIAARRPSSAMDTTVTVATLVGYAIPSFWLGQLAIVAFGLHFDLFPVVGMSDTRVQHEGLAHVWDVARHLVLPASVLAVSEITLLARLTRTGLIRQMREGYARSAAGRGVPNSRILSRHAFPNAALPLVTVIGTRVGFLFSGAVVVETVFSWPGVGLLLRDAVRHADRPLALGLVMLVAVSVVLANVVTDLVYARIDPRIRYD
ncbi:MAG: ABC transporter permease [Acidimicrobiales bacterium]